MTDYHKVTEVDKAQEISIESAEEIEESENKPVNKITDEIDDSSKSPLDVIKGFFNKISKIFEEDEKQALPKNYVTTKSHSYEELFNKLKCKWALQMGVPVKTTEIYRDGKKFLLRCEVFPNKYTDHTVVFRQYSRTFPPKFICYGYAEIP